MPSESSISTVPKRGDISRVRSESPHLHLDVEVVRDEARFLALRDQWSALLDEASGTIYQTHQWQSLWWKHLGRGFGRSLEILLFRSSGILVGIAPFFRETLGLAGMPVYRRLSLLGTGVAYARSFGLFLDDGASDYLDLIAVPAFEQEVASSFLGYLAGHAGEFDEVEMLDAAEDSIVCRVLLPALEGSPFPIAVRNGDRCSRVPLPGSMDEYLRSVSGSVRRRLTQAQKASTSSGIYRLVDKSTKEEFRSALEALIILHQRRWNAMGYAGLFLDRKYRLFVEEFCTESVDRGWLWFKTAETDDQFVASRLGFRFKQTMYDYLSGFDDASPLAKHRPGIALLLAMIEEGIGSHYHTVDLLRGDEAYKADLTDHAFYNQNIVIGSPVPLSGLRKIAAKVVRLSGMGLFLMGREFQLIRVQARIRGPLTCLIHYAIFRGQRAFNKFRRQKSEG